MQVRTCDDHVYVSNKNATVSQLHLSLTGFQCITNCTAIMKRDIQATDGSTGGNFQYNLFLKCMLMCVCMRLLHNCHMTCGNRIKMPEKQASYQKSNTEGGGLPLHLLSFLASVTFHESLLLLPIKTHLIKSDSQLPELHY